jgi:hypothetical protein
VRPCLIKKIPYELRDDGNSRRGPHAAVQQKQCACPLEATRDPSAAGWGANAPPFLQVHRLVIGAREIRRPLLADEESPVLSTDLVCMSNFVQISNRLCCPIPSSVLDMWNSCSSLNLPEIIPLIFIGANLDRKICLLVSSNQGV